MVSEARLRYLQSPGYSEMDVEGVGIIVADAALQYRSEAFTARSWWSPWGRRVRQPGLRPVVAHEREKSGREVARGKTGIVFFDYEKRQVAPLPPAFYAQGVGSCLAGPQEKTQRHGPPRRFVFASGL